MTYEVMVGGSRRVVQLRPAPGGWSVEVDGHLSHVDAVMVHARLSLLVRPQPSNADATGAARSVDVLMEDGGRGEWLVHLSGVRIPVTVIDPRAPRIRRGDALQGAAAGPLALTAPMPGRIVKVLVKPGDRVAARQPLVVVEAMKMENELRAPKSGTVTEVSVSEGASVEAGAQLLVVG